MIKNNRPYTVENGSIDDELLDDVSLETKAIVLDWINDNLQKSKSFNERYSSYRLKHKFEEDTGIYLTNNQFKDGMLMCGFKVENPSELNWHFNISKDSMYFLRGKSISFLHYLKLILKNEDSELGKYAKALVERKVLSNTNKKSKKNYLCLLRLNGNDPNDTSLFDSAWDRYKSWQVEKDKVWQKKRR